MRMSDSTTQLPRITDGTNLILRKLNSTRLIQVRMRKNAGVTVENLKFKLGEALLGKNFGIYNVKNGVLADEATDEEISNFKNVCESAAEPDEIENANDERGNQTKLIREKVQLKQAKRALTLIQIERVNSRLLGELYYSRNVEAVGFLRTDHVGYILEMSGIISNSKALIFDQCSGIVTAHVVERLNGQGHCVLLHNGLNGESGVPCVNNCQFSKEVLSTFRTVSVQRLLDAEEDSSEASEEAVNGDRMELTEDQVELTDNSNNLNKNSTKEMDPNQRELENEALEWFKTESLPNFGCYDTLLIICKNVDACSVLERTLSAVRPSGTIVVYSPSSTVISEAQSYLNKNACVFTTIRSFQQREIQVLKHRTHPLMQQLIVGGYILSGIRCYNP